MHENFCRTQNSPRWMAAESLIHLSMGSMAAGLPSDLTTTENSTGLNN